MRQDSNDSFAPLTYTEMDTCLVELRNSFEAALVISQRANRIVIRWPWKKSGNSIIIKMWARQDVAGSIRRFLGIAACNHEWRNLARLHQLGLAVPSPLGVSRVMPAIAGYTDVLFMEDLGECAHGSDYLRQLIKASKLQEALRFEDAIIGMAARMLAAGILDVDHGIHNVVVQPSGRPVKLDVELGRQVIYPKLFPAMYGQMLGRMIAMHAFAVQPDQVRMGQFAERLTKRLAPPNKVLIRASEYARSLMDKQLMETGIDTKLVDLTG